MHDPRVGRFFSVDPLFSKYSMLSPYAFSGNRVIANNELEGLEPTDSKIHWKRLTPEQEKKKLGKDIKNAVMFKTVGLHGLKESKWWTIPTREDVYVLMTYDITGGNDELYHHYYDKTAQDWIRFDPNNIGANAEEVVDFATYSIGGAATIVGGLIVIEAIGWATFTEFVVEEAVEYAVEAATGFPVINPKDIKDGVGIIYRRFNKKTGKYYIGQTKSKARYDKRIEEHYDNNPDADFEFDVIGTAEPGTKLDVLEEDFIRQAGIPTTKKTKANGTATIENKRYQMNDKKYKENGGKQEKQEGSY
ncbi:hypothetical protein A8C32_17725 [Flavivirga aquatica]|uniref:GIY-YIG domain-containing protein n=1 Tax=Flavivirga aquatica TaxID=1849968 RepID=A0A1E5T7F3_9FLAO|nr:hypothetical protein A8C32_17725 [Flavivirga aquatica]